MTFHFSDLYVMLPAIFLDCFHFLMSGDLLLLFTRMHAQMYLLVLFYILFLLRIDISIKIGECYYVHHHIHYSLLDNMCNLPDYLYGRYSFISLLPLTQMRLSTVICVPKKA